MFIIHIKYLRASKTKIKKLKFYFFLLLTLFAFEISQAQVYTILDTSFGGTGKVMGNEIFASAYIKSVAIQNDEKIIAVGSSGSMNYPYFAIARFNTNGTFDNTFGTNGFIYSSLGGFKCNANSVSIQNDGKIIVAGNLLDSVYPYTRYFTIIRLNIDGSFDTTFSNGGIDTTSFGFNYNDINSLLIQMDGKIVAGGSAGAYYSNGNFALARYCVNGTLDTSFGNGGKVITHAGIANSSISAISIQTDGKIIAAWTSRDSLIDNFVLARYNYNGTLDTTFGINGIVVKPLGIYSSQCTSMTLQNDGKIVTAGLSLDSVNYNSNLYTDFALVRFNANGTVDSSFGMNGIVKTNEGFMNSEAHAVIMQSDGKIIIGGTSQTTSGMGTMNFLALLRYNTDGTLDNTFTFGTPCHFDVPGNFPNESFNALAFQTDGKLIAAGKAGDYTYSFYTEFAIARFIMDTLWVGVENVYSGDNMSLYPNPTNGEILIDIGNPINETVLEIFNTNGNKLLRQKITNNKTRIDIRNLTNGVYFVRIVTEKKVKIRKIIKE